MKFRRVIRMVHFCDSVEIKKCVLGNNEKSDCIREIYSLRQMRFWSENKKLLKALNEALLYGIWESWLALSKRKDHSRASRLDAAIVLGGRRQGAVETGEAEIFFFSYYLFAFIFLQKTV